MTGKELLIEAVKGGTTPRPAWVPFVGVHGGHLIGVAASDYLRSADHIAAALLKAAELYRPDGLPVAFDLQLEAEVLGCDLSWAEQTPPSVISHPLTDGCDPSGLPAFDADAGRFPVVFDALDRVKAEIGDRVALYGLITGPFTLATHLRGNEMFLDLFDDEGGVAKLVDFCAAVGRRVADRYVEHGADVVAVVDPMTSQISPEHFAQFVAPAINDLFDHIRAKGALSSLFVCGDATRNLAAMCRTGCDNVSVDENIPLETLRDLANEAGKSFGGNLKLTTVLLMGDEDDSKLDAIRCIDIGNHQGFVLAPGCDLPYSVPAANLRAVADMVHNEYQRQVARTTITVKTVAHAEDVELPDYAGEKQVYVDVITLDSASCAPCQYMMGAAARAAKLTAADPIVREHKVTTRHGVGAMIKLGVEHIPTICIDGSVAFSSIIPDDRALAKAIDEAAAKKAQPA